LLIGMAMSDGTIGPVKTVDAGPGGVVYLDALGRSDQGGLLACGAFYGTADFGGGKLPSMSLDGFVVRYGANLAHVWSKRFGGAGFDRCLAVRQGPTGQVAFAGTFEGAATFGALDVLAKGMEDGVVGVLSSAGTFLEVAPFGGLGLDEGTDVAFDGTDIVTVGEFKGTADFGDLGSLESMGGTDLFIMRRPAP
jgi:hypothetical protein